jgi:iron(III) transport system permease protein
MRPGSRIRPGVGAFVMGLTILVLGIFLIYPIFLLVLLSFNTAPDILVGPAKWGLSNWVNAWTYPGLLRSLWNSFIIWFLVVGISFPIATAISLLLARTNIPFSHGLEFLFWVTFIFPSIAATVGWMMLLSPGWGFLNQLLQLLPFAHQGPFNIFSIPGIVWVRVMGDGIAFKVMLLTPAFRNMDSALEEAGRVSGASKLSTLRKITLPVMVSPIVLVLALQLIRIFQGFEVEYLLGARWGFFVYSTLIYQLVHLETIPQFAHAVVLASTTLVLIAMIIPLQRWIIHRRPYTTVGSSFRPGLIDLGRWRWVAFSVILAIVLTITLVPALVLVAGSFMVRVGFFNTTPLWTLDHWQYVLSDPVFLGALGTTVVLAVTAGICSPLLFSFLAYMIVRTRWPGRGVLDSIIWTAAAMPGILLGLGLLLTFLTTPGLKWIFGSLWPLLVVIIIAGITTGTNVFKGVLIQLAKDLEEAGRASGAGWLRTYTQIVVPVLLPTMVLIGTLSFVTAAGMTSSIVLLASRQTTTLSLLALQYGAGTSARLEEAGIISLIITAMTLCLALPVRMLALRKGVSHEMRAGQMVAAEEAVSGDTLGGAAEPAR